MSRKTDEPPRRIHRLGFGWGAAGIVTGAAGLGVSLLAADLLGIRVNPVVGVAEAIIRLTPGHVVEKAISTVGHADKPLLVTGVLIALLVLFWLAGRAAAHHPGRALAVFLGLAAVGATAVLTRPDARPTDVIPVVAGGVVWLAVLPFLTTPLRVPPGEQPSRRTFLIRSAGVLVGTAVGVGVGQVLGRGRRQVETTRRLLRLPITLPPVPAGVSVRLRGIAPWQTAATSFYRVDTTIVPPAIEPTDWSLRIHGMVDRELRISYQDLIGRQLTEDWITLNCVSNEVGGNLIGNAWWSGVRLADLLKEAGVQAGADAIKQTSQDGFTCGTPLAAVTDGRNAMLAVGMNGQPLPIEHGFPVRTIVPGLYGYVSACKWVTDIEVTKFSKFTAYWTALGWSEQGPVKLASRIDVPRDGAHVGTGPLRVGGAAWKQDTGIEAVQVSLDGGAWTPVTLGRVPSDDTWVQWSGTVEASKGGHELRVRAVSRTGEVQTGALADVLPNGATGWHTIRFSAA